METIIFDGKGALFGRMGTVVAKELLKGKHVEIINCEEILLSGDMKNFASWIIQKRNMGRGSSLKGPLYSRREERLVKRMIRGMLPFEKTKGRLAWKNLICHVGNGPLSPEMLKHAKGFTHRIPAKHFSIKQVFTLLR